MSTFRATRLYGDGGGLSEAKLDALFNSISDWINARNLDDSNIQDQTITAAKFTSDFVDETSLSITDGSINVTGGSITASTFTEDLTDVKITTNSMSIGVVQASTSFSISSDIDTTTMGDLGSVSLSVSKPTYVLIELIPTTSGGQIVGTTTGDAFSVTLKKNGSTLSVYEITQSSSIPDRISLYYLPNEFRWIYYEDTAGTYTYTINIDSAFSANFRILAKEL